ncbi:hypothetical protein F5148DRAFT_1282272 [Russula earlei]|uniref:Uncharacterized protein n=1 Tax=Russula earlei TaxID=71964 RepID=A0ACC0UEL3_9AGAM|nr:hypothetical protein F5148DRAFT_1282272 [Russula earlei]
MSTIEIATTTTTSRSGAGIDKVGMNAFSGLGGYMTLGLGSKLRPCVTDVGDAEVLIAKDNEGLFIGLDGQPSRKVHVPWPAPPEDVSFVAPYISGGSVLKALSGDAGSVPRQPTFCSSSVLQIRSLISLQISQSLPFPFNPPQSTSPSAPINYTLRLLTPSPSAKSPLFLVSTPMDWATATLEGSSLWCIRMRSWGEQVDELIDAGNCSRRLPNARIFQDQRTNPTKAVDAISHFRAGDFGSALHLFVKVNANPAKVISLYPEAISGRLSVPRDPWIPIFGGPKPEAPQEGVSWSSSSSSSEHGCDVEEPPLSGDSGIESEQAESSA